MGLLDNLKAKLSPAKGKVSDLAQQHGGKIQHGLDKAAKVADEKTKGKYSDKIHRGTGKAKDAMDRLAHKDEGTGGNAGGGTGTGGGTPPPSAPPPSTPPPAS
ncbi:antitoxin [Streptomyces sp. NBC_00287]|uniref:antitoxin n=1 Tax=Streptomyces sp. NBC_00287 TaxID=2975702 RepID=UPI002E2C0FDB|nr:antitoxin [Streptomyces sp. NBC_00287]